MTFILGLVQMLLIAYIALYEFEQKSSSVFLWATLFIMFGVMHFLASIIGDLEYSDAIIRQASLFVIAFCFLYILVRKIVAKVSTRHRKDYSYAQIKELLHEENFSDNFLFCLFVIIIIAWVGPYIAFVGGIGNTSWGNLSAYSEGLSYVNSGQFVCIFFYAFAGCGALFFLKDRKLYFALFCILMLLDVIITTNRIEILPLLCVLITLYLMKTERLSKKTIVFAGISSILVVYLVYGLRVFRHYGTISEFIKEFEFKEFIGKINLYLKTGNGELGLLRDMYYFMDNNNQFENFGKMHSYLRMLLVYIPTRFSFGLKPPDFAVTMGAAKGYLPGHSTHPTLFGDCYANAGMWGIFLGIFWALYVSCADKVVDSRKTQTFSILTYVLNAVVFVIMGRGSVYNSFFYVAYGVPLLILCEWLVIRFGFRGTPLKDFKFSFGRRKYNTNDEDD